MTIVAVVLILLAGFFIVGVGANLAELHRSDAAGNGMAEGFLVLMVIGIWIQLSILLAICGSHDGFPGRSGIAMLVVFLLGLAAQGVTLRILTESRAQGIAAILLPMVVVAAPVLLMLRAVWGIFPSLRAMMPETAGSWAPIVLLLLISLIPYPFLPSYFARKAALLAASAAIDREYRMKVKAEDDQRVRETLAKIAALPEDGPLVSILTYSGYQDDTIREAARARARTFTNRQAGAEELLGAGQELTLREIAYLDLRATPVLCERAKAMLAAKGAIRPADDDPVRIEDAEREVAPFLETMKWLLANGCDCKPEIAGLEKAVGLYGESRRREKLLASLAAVKKGGRDSSRAGLKPRAD